MNPLHAPTPDCPGWDGGGLASSGAGVGGAPLAVAEDGGGGVDGAIPVHLFHKHVSELHMDQVGKKSRRAI